MAEVARIDLLKGLRGPGSARAKAESGDGWLHMRRVLNESGFTRHTQSGDRLVAAYRVGHGGGLQFQDLVCSVRYTHAGGGALAVRRRPSGASAAGPPPHGGGGTDGRQPHGGASGAATARPHATWQAHQQVCRGPPPVVRLHSVVIRQASAPARPRSALVTWSAPATHCLAAQPAMWVDGTPRAQLGVSFRAVHRMPSGL